MIFCERVVFSRRRTRYWREDICLQYAQFFHTRNIITNHHAITYPQPSAGYYRLYPRTEQQAPPQAAPQRAAQNAASTSQPKESLISKYNLQSRVAQSSAGAESSTSAVEPEHKWEESAEKREASLRERKARMVLAARKCVFRCTI